MKSNSILIVDDNTNNIKVLGSLLKANNFNVEFALNGKSAIDWVSKNNFDLILLDVMMPEMDGFEVATILKKDPQKQDIPIIFLTAKSDEESILKGFKSGGVDFLTKPFNHSELLARVSTHLALRNAHREIELKNKLLFDSMNYAKLIQNALLSTEEFNRIFPENFIIYQPKDIVSGDFYWIHEYKNKVFLAAADCTGHGIPGAFMSVLGIALLNEIVLSNRMIETNEILNILRSKIKILLTRNESTLEEGMDITLCIFDFEKLEMQFSGGQSSIYIVSKGKLTEIKGDKQPVGAFPVEKEFLSKKIEIKKNDKLYFASDGIKDQFGGPNDKKIGTKNFVNLILSIHNEPMSMQGDKIENCIKGWKKDLEQIDDIMVIGVQI